MKEYVVQTMNAARSYIDNDMQTAGEEKTRRVLSEFEIKISYFQHERLIHLLVTLTFAILTVAAMLVIVIHASRDERIAIRLMQHDIICHHLQQMVF